MRRFPIYKVRWVTEGLETVIFHDRMLRSESLILTNWDEWRANSLEAALKRDAGHSAGEIEVRLSHHGEWCMTWFCHYTFRDDLDAGAALDSFESYVQRMERKFPESYSVDHIKEMEAEHGYYLCLMGASDRWRWRGADEDDGGRTPAPCNCSGCVEQGVWRVNH